MPETQKNRHEQLIRLLLESPDAPLYITVNDERDNSSSTYMLHDGDFCHGAVTDGDGNTFPVVLLETTNPADE